ncbi:MAG: PorV/PorQ family protein [Bacteroidota bacterium]|nr:PorV/PorQ family protein [Bacteroidota bacterium]
MKKLALVTLLAMLYAVTGYSQTAKSGINALAFLKIGVGGKQVSLGSAATTLTGDPNQMFWNPAGIVDEPTDFSASVSYSDWLLGLKQEAGALTYNLSDIGTLGVGFITFGVSGIPADRDVLPASLSSLQIDQQTSSTYDYNDMAIVLSFARHVSDVLSLGVNVKYLHETIDDMSAGAFAVDIGSDYRVTDFWSVGAKLSNLGSDIKYYDISSPIPLTFSVGTSLHNNFSDALSGALYFDVVQPQDLSQLYYTGIDLNVIKMVDFRFGYKFNYSDTKDAGTSLRAPIETSIEGFSAGLGANVNLADYGLRFDYTFTQMHLLSDVHRFTLSFNWGK